MIKCSKFLLVLVSAVVLVTQGSAQIIKECPPNHYPYGGGCLPTRPRPRPTTKPPFEILPPTLIVVPPDITSSPPTPPPTPPSSISSSPPATTTESSQLAIKPLGSLILQLLGIQTPESPSTPVPPYVPLYEVPANVLSSFLGFLG